MEFAMREHNYCQKVHQSMLLKSSSSSSQLTGIYVAKLIAINAFSIAVKKKINTHG